MTQSNKNLAWCVLEQPFIITDRRRVTFQTDIPSLGIECPTDRPGESLTFADPDHCSKYWECYNGCATYFQCPLDYLYDDSNGWCDSAENVSCS